MWLINKRLLVGQKKWKPIFFCLLIWRWCEEISRFFWALIQVCVTWEINVLCLLTKIGCFNILFDMWQWQNSTVNPGAPWIIGLSKYAESVDGRTITCAREKIKESFRRCSVWGFRKTLRLYCSSKDILHKEGKESIKGSLNCQLSYTTEKLAFFNSRVKCHYYGLRFWFWPDGIVPLRPNQVSS